MKIKFQKLDELKAEEDLPERPKLVQRYLDLKKLKVKGSHFWVEIQEESRDSGTDGIAYLNELRIKKRRQNGSWVKVYSSGMLQYRGAYNWEIDDWDLAFRDPAILKETPRELIFGLQTGAGNVKIYHFQGKEGGLESLAVFNTREEAKSQKRVELLQRIFDDAEAFKSYVAERSNRYWHTSSLSELRKGKIAVLLREHYDRDYDAVVDAYEVYVWVKGKGFSKSEEYTTGLIHPPGKFYVRELSFNASVRQKGKKLQELTVKVYNSQQPWERTHRFSFRL